MYTINNVKWVKSANSTWICHGGLADCTAIYLESLNKLELSLLCRRVKGATLLGMLYFPNPKTFFYPSCFSNVPYEDLEGLLKDYWFTRAVLTYYHKREFIVGIDGMDLDVKTKSLIPIAAQCVELGDSALSYLHKIKE
jgi:hypothetical protein